MPKKVIQKAPAKKTVMVNPKRLVKLSPFVKGMTKLPFAPNG